MTYLPVPPPGYVAPLADWPEPGFAVSLRQCAVNGCDEDKSLEIKRGGTGHGFDGTREVMRRWCQKHALFYDVEVTRRVAAGAIAPVIDIATGERVG